MRKIIDANYFAAPALAEYLEADSQNVVVFTDFACMESYGGHAADRGRNALVSIAESLKTVSRHPSQVLVLKSISEIVRLQGGYPHATPDDFVDRSQTAEFAPFCGQVEHARATGSGAGPVFEHGDAAAKHIGGAMLEDARSFPEWFEWIRKELGPDYIRRLRTDTPPKDGDLRKITKCVLQRAAAGFMVHSDRPRPPRRSQLFRQTMIFRFALAHFALAEWFLSRGGPLPAPERLRNDLVDMTYVAAATFFDGILTNEPKVTEIHGLTVGLLGLLLR